MKIVKKILLALLLVLIGMQLYRPEKNSSEYDVIAQFEAETRPSKEVSAILQQKCYDCHSNQTNYPWYAEVSPISLWINDHIEEGKEHFNVSDWDTYSLKKKDHKLEEFIEEVEEGKMPEDAYTWIHGDLLESEKKALIQWAQETRSSYNVLQGK
ncbi:MAG: heme-binding domain-containing protein [Bacteroidota bacterium]